MLGKLYLIGAGIVLGIANVIPGVSGGTMAVVLNIYDRLLAVIVPSFRKILSHWKFWLPLGIGVLIGILFFSKLVSFLFANYPAPTRFFFIGIISGSIPFIYTRMSPAGAKFPPLSSLICACVTFALMLAMFVMHPVERIGATDVSFQFAVFLAFAGVVAAVAMIIPGISGSFLLLAMGLYQTIIGAAGSLVDSGLSLVRGVPIGEFISSLRFPVFVLVPVLFGVLIGLFCGAALVRFLMRNIPHQTYGAILGLIIGSILVIFPERLPSNTFMIVVSVICFLAGSAVSMLFAISGRRTKSKSRG